MLTRICPSLALLLALPLFPQAAPSATGTAMAEGDEAQMQTPPPVSGLAYPSAVGAETRSNYLLAGLVVNSGYDDNVLAGAGAKPVKDVTYSIMPTIAIDQTEFRQRRTFTYSPGFSFYQPTSALNEVDQNARAAFQYRLSQHTTINVQDAFQKSSTVFSQSPTDISGTPGGAPETVVAPFGERLSNAANAELSYQYSRNGMVGASGIYTLLDYPNPTQSVGLYNSDVRGASAFYSSRLSKTQYLGVTYQYVRSQSDPPVGQSEAQTQAIFPFYTVYFKSHLSLSLSGGPQYSNIIASPLPPSHSWTPAAMASIGWQRPHTNFAANYSRIVTGGGGLLGAFESSAANATARWQMARTWTAGLTASYAINKSLTPLALDANPGGHSISGQVTAQHSIGERLGAELGYQRLHQSYSGIAAIATAPDSDRVYLSISYQFRRPLGR
jgi:hypothetical protein